MKDFIIVILLLSVGAYYYFCATSKSAVLRRIALFGKIGLLAVSFLLEFVRQDFITIGQFALSGRITILLLVLFEIADALISDRKKQKRKSSDVK